MADRRETEAICAVYAAIPGFVACDLSQPEGGVGLGGSAVLGATMPDLSAIGLAEAEAAVHEYYGFKFRENEVRPN